MDATLYTVGPAVADPVTEGHIVVNTDRTVTVPECLKDIAVLLDHNIETVTFDCPRYWDGHDLSTMRVYVHYRCADGKTEPYPCDNVVVDDVDDTIMHFDWTISDSVTCAVGTIAFLVCIKETDANGVRKRRFSSRLNKDMRVLEGLGDPADDIVERNPDLIESILNRLDELEAHGGGGILAETDPTVFVWAKSHLPFTVAQLSAMASGAGFVVNPTNFADGKTYFRYHAGANSFTWTNPNPQRGAVTITVLAWSQYGDKSIGDSFSRLIVVYGDGTTEPIWLKNGQTVTLTTDAGKVLAEIRGNYDHENWVLLDMSVLTIAADYPAPTGTVKSVNDNLPDEDGNVQIPILVGATSDTDGASGLAPAPAAGDEGKVLFGNGTWGDLPESGGGSGTASEKEWTKLGDVTVNGATEFIPISFTGGIVTLDTAADGYDDLSENGYTNCVVHPIDPESTLSPVIGKLKAVDYSAGTFEFYNPDSAFQSSAAYDPATYKITLRNVGSVVMENVPTDYKRYKARVTAPVLVPHGLRDFYTCTFSYIGLGACLSVAMSRGAIVETELYRYPYNENYMYKRIRVAYGNLYGGDGTKETQSFETVSAGVGKTTPPENGVVSFSPSSCVFCNGMRFELWGANVD